MFENKSDKSDSKTFFRVKVTIKWSKLFYDKKWLKIVLDQKWPKMFSWQKVWGLQRIYFLFINNFKIFLIEYFAKWS